MSRIKLKTPLVILGILAVGVLGLVAMIAFRPKPPEVVPEKEVPVVVAVRPEVHSGRVMVQGYGTVRPVQEVNLVAEVAGKVVDVSPAMVTGGFFRQGQVLLRIDPTDYEHAVAVAQAEVTQRQFEVLTVEEEGALAREEWDRLQRRTGQQVFPDSSALGVLAWKEPHLLAAQARLKGAQARLSDAETRLQRTRLVAPFAGRVRMENIAVGQVVGPGQVLASLYSTEAVEVAVPLPSADAALLEDLWLQERKRGQGPRLDATVTAELGGQTLSWEGFIDRSEGTVDPTSRTLSVVVRIPKPFESQEGPPLMPGTFVTVTLPGKHLERYLVIPSEALREDQTIWVVKDGRLHRRNVEVIQEIDGKVVMTNGIADDEQVVISPLDVATEGMHVRVME